ncbi:MULTISPECIES: hypothetical protein [unclassified Corynebacterium]|uniref:hypothetical protein n=1 Tax=unclassified Corynebacterium TaxID=2624378 RepID=UPI003098E84B
MTDGIEQWVLDLPLWLQTPLTLVVFVAVASAVAVVLMKVAFGVLPATADERRAFGSPGNPADPPGAAASRPEGENR